MKNTIFPIKAFSDNYIWCLHNTSKSLIVDPGDANAVIQNLNDNNLDLTTILITHHHYDHIDGLQKLCELYNPTVYVPHDQRIPNSENYTLVKENQEIVIAEFDLKFKALELPGHTLTHIAYFNNEILFCGDTLFSLGCGRMFEGNPTQFNDSLNKLKQLDDQTLVYCTHEYTQSNIDFHKCIYPMDERLPQIEATIESRFEKQGVSLPSTIKFEKENNLFLRTADSNLRQHLFKTYNQSIKNDVDMFATLRKLKDNF